MAMTHLLPGAQAIARVMRWEIVFSQHCGRATARTPEQTEE